MIDEAARAEMRRLVLGEGWKICTVARRFSVHHTVVRRAVFGTTLDKARATPRLRWSLTRLTSSSGCRSIHS